jgi:hypothetical protein
VALSSYSQDFLKSSPNRKSSIDFQKALFRNEIIYTFGSVFFNPESNVSRMHSCYNMNVVRYVSITNIHIPHNV